MNNPFDKDNLREIGVTLARNKTRTLMTAFGIFWGTAMLAMLWGGADGMRGMLLRKVTGFTTNSGVVFSNPTTMSYKGFNKGMIWNLTDRDVEIIRQITPELQYFAPIVNRGATIKYGSQSLAGVMLCVTGDYPRILTPRIYEGRFVNDNDVKTFRKVVVIGKNVAQTLFGNESPLGKLINVNGVYMLIVGVAGQLSEMSFGARLDDGVIVPLTVGRASYSSSDVINYAVFTANPGHTPTDLRPFFERAVRVSHPIHPQDKNALAFKDISEEFKKVETMFLAISLLAIFVGGGTLMAGIIGVGNIMWIVVKERTKEIGIRRAIGATPRDIIMQILSESILLTLVAGMAGLVFATLVLAVVDHFTFDSLYGSANFGMPPMRAFAILGVFIFFGALAGLVPAMKAMHIKPVEAINSK